MTTGAWVMLATTWAIVIGYTLKFFLKVLRTPIDPDRLDQMRDGILEKDA